MNVGARLVQQSTTTTSLVPSDAAELHSSNRSMNLLFRRYEANSTLPAASLSINITAGMDFLDRSLAAFMDTAPNETLNMNGTFEGESGDGLDYVVTAVAGVILALVIIVTIGANALILIAFYTHQNLQRRPTNHFYASLAFSDLAAGIFVLPLAAYDSLLGMDEWKLGKVCCVTWISIDYFVYNASVYVMCAICLDRYMCILHAVYYRNKRSLRLVRGMNVVAWLLGFVTSVPGMVLWEPVSGVSIIDYDKECFEEWMDNMPFVILSLIVTIFIPLFMIFFLYIRIYLAARYTAPPGRSTATPTKKAIASASYPLRTIGVSQEQEGNATDAKDKLPREVKTEITDVNTSLPSGEQSTTLQPLTAAKPQVCNTHGNAAFLSDAAVQDQGQSPSQSPADGTPVSKSDADGDAGGTPVKTNSHQQGEQEPLSGQDQRGEGVGKDESGGNQADDSGENSESDIVEMERRRQSNARKPQVAHRSPKIQRERSAKRQRRDRRAAKVLGTLVGFFLLSYTPWAVAMIMDSFCTDVCLSPTVYSIAAWLQYSNSIVNPFLYVYNDRDFRVAVANVLEAGLCCCRIK